MNASKPHTRLLDLWESMVLTSTLPYNDRENSRAQFALALDGLVEQLQSAETTLAHAEAFIEHQDMSYRWAEWCEGRDPNPASVYKVGPAEGDPDEGQAQYPGRDDVGGADTPASEFHDACGCEKCHPEIHMQPVEGNSNQDTRPE